MQPIVNFFQAMWREIVEAFQALSDMIVEIFDPQSGWTPKVIFGAIMLLIIFWVAKRGTKSA